MLGKKITCLTLGLIMTASMFAGCGTKTNSTSSGTDSSSSSSTAAKDDKKDTKETEAPYKLKYYTIGTPQGDLGAVATEASKYLKEKINAELEMVQFDWGDYDKKMQTIISSGEKFDLCFTCSWANDYKSNSRRGAFEEVTPLMEQYGKEMKEAINPGFFDGSKVNGKNFAIPVNKELGQQRVFRFVKKYADKYNIDYSKIHTYEDLEPALKKVKEGESDIIAPYRPGIYELNFDYLIENTPLIMDIDKNNGKFENMFENEKLINYFKTLRNYYNKGYIRKDIIAADKNGGTEEDKSGLWFGDCATTQPYADKLWSDGFKYDVVTSELLPPVINNTATMGSMIAISVTSGNKEKSMQFLNLLNTDKYLRNLINYGIEGTHYKKLDEEHIEMTAQGKDKYNMPAFSLGNIFLTYLAKGVPSDKWQKFDEFNKASKPAPTLGFDFNEQPVKNQLASIKAAYTEFRPLFLGAVDTDEYVKKANAKFKAVGIDKVLAEAQKQYDEWKKTSK